jgi:signal transduction histidine kinase/ligand-binding sensor domain-containing protein/DNA-binding NarL/FixJ family response regulator
MMHQKFTFIMLWVSMNAALMAQSKVRFEEVYAINSLSHNGVTCLHQDKLGFLWVGTFNGLNKYDGYSFSTYRFNRNESNPTSTNRNISIHEDRFGNLWVLTYDGDYHRFNPSTEKYRNFPDEKDSTANIRFNGIFESGGGIVSLTSSKWGVVFITHNNSDADIRIHHLYADQASKTRLTNNNVTFVIEDSNKDFWIGTERGLNRINEDELEKDHPEITAYYYGEGDPSSEPVSFTTAREYDGKIWFGTKKHGPILYDPALKKFVDLSGYPGYKDFESAEITAFRSTDDDLWMGTAQGRLVRYSAGLSGFSVYEIEDPRSGNSINQIYADKYHQVWLKTNKLGITRFNPSQNRFYYYMLTPRESANITDDQRIVILEDSKNKFWLGGQNIGIQYYDRESDRFTPYLNDPRDPNSLPSDVVECIFEDREGNLWVGTNWFGKGLSRMITIDPAFEYIQPNASPRNKNENVIRAVKVDSRGNIWAATKNGQVYIYDPALKLRHIIDKNNNHGYSGFNVYSISQDADGYMWLCTKGAGVFRSQQSISNNKVEYNRITFTAIQHEPHNENSLSSNVVYDLEIDKLGRIWVATYGSGLDMIETAENGRLKFHHYTTENSSITSNNIRDLYIDTRGRIWIATTYGVNYTDLYKSGDRSFGFKNIISHPSRKKGLSYNDIIMIIEDRKGHIWLASSGGGVNKILNPESDQFNIAYYTAKIGLKDDYILSLVEDIYGFIWIGTNSGLSRYNPINGEIKNFDKKNGLPEILFSEQTATTSPSGKVLFGTVSGLYAIQPNKIIENSIRPTICLTGFKLNNLDVTPGGDNSPLQKTISYSRQVVLKSDQSNFSIEFSLLSFKSPESNHYEYVLEGFSKGWSYIGTEHKATFTNIPPGKYKFRVKGLDSNLSEYGTEASLGITVLPPVWKTKVAILIYILLFAGLAYLAFNITRRFVFLKNEVKIEKRVAESKLRFFTNISHEIRTPLTLILGPLDKLISHEDLRAEVKLQLHMIHRNSKRLLRMVNQILDFRKVQNEKMVLKIQEIELIPFLRQIYDSFEELAQQKNIRFNLIYDHKNDHMAIWGDIQKLDTVFFNLLANAFKFTPENGRISIIVSYADEPDGSIKVVVSDTGIGIEKDKLDLIFDRFFVSHTVENDLFQGTGIGLSLCLEYIRLHQGEIKAESTPGKGTDFTVRLLAGNSHFPEDVIVKEREAYSYSPKIHDIEGIVEIEEKTGEAIAETDDRYHILIVEDDIEMCNYLSTMLEKTYKVSLAKNGKDGWTQAQELVPDLIITDIMMPVMNGIEFTRKVKEEFGTCHIPVIMLSAKSEIESQVEGLQTGAEAYLPKPFNMDLLISYVQSFINQREKIKEFFNSRIELKPDEVQVTSKDKEFINTVIKMIDDNISDPEFNVEKLASGVFISRTLFYKKIKGITGYQPVELMRMMRLKKAAQFIASGEYNVSEVAYMVGYNDIRYFSSSFKKQFGVSPSKYQTIKTEN